ncbi:MAG: hypothetical protein MJD61_18665 [Proteobacteria bacterium]|nr:hypothetical protein [Pseudomonadota bacterium]
MPDVGRRKAALALPALALLTVGCSRSNSGNAEQPPLPPLDAAADATAGHADAGSTQVPQGGVCSTDGWCWELPYPQGHDLLGVWARSASDIWAVGEHGLLMHFDGSEWRNEPGLSEESLNSVWGAGNTVWAVGDRGVVLVHDGSGWSEVIPSDGGSATTGAPDPPRDDLHAVRARAGDVWIAGEAGLLWHFDGSRWNREALGTSNALRAVWAASGSDSVWIAGDQGTLLHFDGTEWTHEDPGTSRDLLAIDGLNERDLWVVGERGTALHFDGRQWEASETGFSGHLTAVVADSTAPGARPGAAGAPDASTSAAGTGGGGMDAGTDAGAAGSGGDPIWRAWAFGDDGSAWRYGQRWTPVASGTRRRLEAATRLAKGQLLVVGERGIVQHWSDGARSLLSHGSLHNRLSIRGGPNGRVWSVGDELLVRRQGTWAVQENPTPRSLYGLWADNLDLWAVGTGGTIVRHRQDAWSEPARVNGARGWLRAVGGSSDGAAWIVGNDAATLIRAGSTWIDVDNGYRADLLAVWGQREDDFWAVGSDGAALHWDGSAWADVPTSADGSVGATLRAVWGAASDDVWAGGTGGILLHWDGRAWSLVTEGESYSINDVWGRAADDVWAVGTGGTLLHYDGNRWSAKSSGTRNSLESIWGDARGNLWTVGLHGTVLRYSAQQ